METALVLPIFLYLMLGVLFFVQFMETAGATEQKIHDRAKQMAVYAYDSRQITQNQPTKSMGWLILGYVFVKKICNCKEIVKLIGIRSLRFFHPYSLR